MIYTFEIKRWCRLLDCLRSKAHFSKPDLANSCDWANEYVWNKKYLNNPMAFVSGDSLKFMKKGRACAVIAIFLFLCCFAVGVLGTYLIWIFAGASLYFIFLAIYYFVLSAQAKYPYRKKYKETEQEKAVKAHIRLHLPIVISVLLGGALIALLVALFFK